jgi:hypothetical protein
MKREQRNNWQRRRTPPGRTVPAGTRGRQGGSDNARLMYERYLALAREAASAGDTVEMENCYQHAEHYFRVMRAKAEVNPQPQPTSGRRP